MVLVCWHAALNVGVGSRIAVLVTVLVAENTLVGVFVAVFVTIWVTVAEITLEGVPVAVSVGVKASSIRAVPTSRNI
jgi:hypothetical protein